MNYLEAKNLIMIIWTLEILGGNFLVYLILSNIHA
jgi:hypothetical protein